MNRTTLTAIAAAVSLVFSAAAMSAMTKADYNTAKDNIHAEYKSGKAACDSLKDNAKDICVAQAKGKENVALADLAVTYKPTQKTRYDARLARADADYSVAKEKCDDQTGNAKDVCKKEAEAAYVTAKADAKTQKKVADAKKDAASDKRDANYAVAKEKCDAMSGDAKDRCVQDAKTLYGKT